MTHSAFVQAITTMEGTLYRISSSLLAQPCDREDAVQSALEKAWRKQGALRDESKFGGWVVRILINECYNILRWRKREMSMEALPEQPAPPGADSDLYRFFSGLPDKLRLPMVLFYVEGYKIEEISLALRLPSGTVKSRLSRGRGEMKKNDAFKEVQDL